MFVQLRNIKVTEGNADKVIEQYIRDGIIHQQKGFVDSTVMVKQSRRGDEEVMVMIRWESEDYWKQWEKSDAHIAGHKAKIGKPRPDFILQIEVSKYEVKSVKTAT